MNRRAFLQQSANGFGATVLGTILSTEASALGVGQHAARAKRVIYLFQSGGPSQVDLFDPKPGLVRRRGEELPASVRGDQRITTMTSGNAVKESQVKEDRYSESSRADIRATSKMARLAAINTVTTIARRVLCHQDKRVQLSNRICTNALRNEFGFGANYTKEQALRRIVRWTSGGNFRTKKVAISCWDNETE